MFIRVKHTHTGSEDVNVVINTDHIIWIFPSGWDDHYDVIMVGDRRITIDADSYQALNSRLWDPET